MSITIAAMTDAHAEQVLAIYQAGIDEGNATFETTAPDWAAFTTVGRGQCVGKHHGRWRDVLLVERRSTIAGQ